MAQERLNYTGANEDEQRDSCKCRQNHNRTDCSRSLSHLGKRRPAARSRPRTLVAGGSPADSRASSSRQPTGTASKRGRCYRASVGPRKQSPPSRRPSGWCQARQAITAARTQTCHFTRVIRPVWSANRPLRAAGLHHRQSRGATVERSSWRQPWKGSGRIHKSPGVGARMRVLLPRPGLHGIVGVCFPRLQRLSQQFSAGVVIESVVGALGNDGGKEDDGGSNRREDRRRPVSRRRSLLPPTSVEFPQV